MFGWSVVLLPNIASYNLLAILSSAQSTKIQKAEVSVELTDADRVSTFEINIFRKFIVKRIADLVCWGQCKCINRADINQSTFFTHNIWTKALTSLFVLFVYNESIYCTAKFENDIYSEQKTLCSSHNYLSTCYTSLNICEILACCMYLIPP